MDYKTELNRLQQNEAQSRGDYWKPVAGQYVVKALSEIEEGKPYEEEGKEPQLRKQIRLLIDGEESVWTFPHGQTPASAYGQLVNLGANKGNLTGQTFTVVVTGTEKTKRFTIVI